MRFHKVIGLACALIAVPSCAQWDIQDAHTKADLRGIHYVGNGVAWASGTNGTVLRTEDMGFVWQLCAVPPGAEKLDFRGIQAFDNNTAIVMSSGTGDLSRLYKTTDGCQTWKLVFTNPDPKGFWDTIAHNSNGGLLIGDPVDGRFQIYSSDSQMEHWSRFGEKSSFRDFRFDLSPYEGEALFAASNSIFIGDPLHGIAFASGGKLGARFSFAAWQSAGEQGFPVYTSYKTAIPLASGDTAGAFSFAVKERQNAARVRDLVAVGGDYTKPEQMDGTAAWSRDYGKHWKPSITPAHGYRSAVAYDTKNEAWITVGPNGTDISSDDGRNWHPLKPGPGDAPDADKNWNALSLPFVVGPKGRIGILRDPSSAQPASK